MCVAGGNASILKMLQISTAFPRNHKHVLCLPAGFPPPHCTEQLDSPGEAWSGSQHGGGAVGIHHPVEVGAPLLPGQDVCLAPPLSVLWYGSAPGTRRVCGHLLCQIGLVFMVSMSPVEQFRGGGGGMGGGGGQPIPAPGRWLATALELFNTEDSVHTLGFQLAAVGLGDYFLRPGSPPTLGPLIPRHMPLGSRARPSALAGSASTSHRLWPRGICMWWPVRCGCGDRWAPEWR